MKNVLLIGVCKEKLHELEFVRPISEIIRKREINLIVKHYSSLKKEDLTKATHIIISGTSLKDNEFIKNNAKFNWLLNINKPVLGICAGMEIIGLIFGGKLKKNTEIGFFKEVFTKNFLGLDGENQVYHLHNNYCSLPKNFIEFTNSSLPQAIRHKEKEIYGCLFHPEVRQKETIINFIKIKKKNAAIKNKSILI
jgi:GMP synthase (glutamine-hydrolysing)